MKLNPFKNVVETVQRLAQPTKTKIAAKQQKLAQEQADLQAELDTVETYLVLREQITEEKRRSESEVSNLSGSLDVMEKESSPTALSGRCRNPIYLRDAILTRVAMEWGRTHSEEIKEAMMPGMRALETRLAEHEKAHAAILKKHGVIG